MSCGQKWLVSNNFSIYEQQAVESCPCPRCAAYTLCCHEPREAQSFEKSQPVRDWRPVALPS
jgi:hypothetical protein